MPITLEQAKKYGFTFPEARGWYDPGKTAQLAQDAALVTLPNSTVPVELLAYIDPRVIEILTAPRRAREIFSETRKGNWTTAYQKWRTDEVVGRTQAYSDFAQNGVADVNSNWKAREQYLFQTVIQYGDLETAVAGAAMIDFAAAKQRAAATVINIDANRFYLLGVAGKEIYGILNDPDLPSAIVAAANGTGSVTTHWSGKTTQQIYEDVLALFSELVSQSAGLIDNSTPLILVLSPATSVFLGAATDFNVSVLDMLNKYFSSLKIVTLPELASLTAGNTAFLIAPEIAGMPTGELGYGEKVLAGRVVPELSALKQKYVSSTYGGLVLIPFAFAPMTGM
jgi:hypothetical protein